MPKLLAFRDRAARSLAAGFADLDPFACNLRLRAISAGDRAELATHIPPRAGSGAHRRVPARRCAGGPEPAADDGDAIDLRSLGHRGAAQDPSRASSRRKTSCGRVGAAARAPPMRCATAGATIWQSRSNARVRRRWRERDAASLLAALDEALAVVARSSGASLPNQVRGRAVAPPADGRRPPGAASAAGG